MNRKEAFKKAADDYVNGEPDGAQKIVGQVGFEFGAEYGYQYAIEKACEWLTYNLHLVRDWSGTPAQNYRELVRMLRKAMEE